MFSTLFTTYGLLGRLYRRLDPSRPRLLLTASLLIASGALEGATIGLLVPLLGMLTGAMDGAANLVPMFGPLFAKLDDAYRIPLLAAGILVLVAL